MRCKESSNQSARNEAVTDFCRAQAEVDAADDIESLLNKYGYNWYGPRRGKCMIEAITGKVMKYHASNGNTRGDS
uniref:Uncharacterized protein n=1 Tax=Hyaloperonospora arabidopsidis (strain Emoy2) TaxID=559515 RepID=M4C0W0_HYAAE